MSGVEQVQQLDDRRLHWRGKVAGKVRDWDATITEQVPDERIAWQATSGKRNDGIVRFEPLGNDTTRVEVEMAFEPEGVAELVGSAIGLPERRVKGDLERFRELIEDAAASRAAHGAARSRPARRRNTRTRIRHRRLEAA